MGQNGGIRNVAVIGAGAAGLVTAREISRAGLNVRVFEQSADVGGLWVYEPATESDALGQSVERRIHSSLYESLRTNLPRDIMAFSDYTFDSRGGGDDNWPRFPHHTQVRRYLENFARDFHLLDSIQFKSRITRLEAGAGDSRIKLDWESAGESAHAWFDAVAICNGHFSKPRVPLLANMVAFAGRVLHSHNYRQPGEFAGKKVAVFGVAASGVDIAYEISREAEAVYWCGDAFNALDGAQVCDPDIPNLHYYSCPTAVDDSGEILFKKNTPLAVDVLLYATGYHYDYPFLQGGEIRNEDNYLSPLYKQIIPASRGNMGFIGIPFLLIPFPFFEIQARWFAQVLKGKIRLPVEQEMVRAVESREAWLRGQGRKPRQYHQLGEEQAGYLNELLGEMGAGPLPRWFLELVEECQRVRVEHPTTFRDEIYTQRGPSTLPAGA
jgi:thioredoxin reductase